MPAAAAAGEAAVHLDHDLDIGPNRLADRSHELDGLPLLRRRQRHPGATEWIELERGVATSNGVERFLCDRDRVAVGLVPAVRIRSHAVAVFPAQKLPDRNVQFLTDEVPAGEIERSQGRLCDLTWPAVLRALDVERQRLPVERISSDDITVGELGDAGDQRVRLVDHADLAEATPAVVRDELDEGELAPRCSDDGRDDLDDPHASTALACSSAVRCRCVRRSCSVCWRWSRMA